MYQDSGTPVETEGSSLTQGCRVTHPSQWEVPLRVSVGDPSPGAMGLGVLSRVAGRPAVRAGAVAVSRDSHTSTVLGASAGVPGLSRRTTGPAG